MKSQLSTNSLRKLRSSLPYGAVSKLAEQLSVTQSLVSKVLHGHSQNDTVIQAAIQMAKESAEETNRLENEIQSL